MPDWIGGDGHTTAETYRLMAENQLRGVSASYERLCLAVAGRADVCALIDRLPVAKRQPNLLLGAVRYLDGPVDDSDRFCAFLLEQWPAVEQVMRTHATQTNEPGRCATLLPQLALLDGPLALLEVGASAGLCLFPDRYGYDYSGTTLGEGTPRLRCELTGAVPERLPDVRWRGGLDLNPLDVTSDEDVRWLESLVWPEQDARFATLREAVTVARADPPRVVAGDLTRDVAALALQAPADATLVIFHSAVLAYVPPAGREQLYDTIRALREARPTVWLANEAAGVVPGTADVDAPSHSFVLARDGEPVALTGPHGQSYRALG